jgi:hypothetical protein
MKSVTLALFASLLMSVAAFAHGNFEHVLGTVTKIEGNSIMVVTVSGENKTVTIVTPTKFVKSGSPATQKDLKVGDRVVIHAKPIGSTLEAAEVKFGETPKAAPPQH